MISVVEAHVQAMRAAAAAMIAQCDAMLAVIAATAAETGPCEHPQRAAAPRMGAPRAWLCQTCGAQGEE